MFVATYLGSCLAQAAAYCACQAVSGFSREMMMRSARLAFSFLFFCGLIVAWVMRDFARPLIEKIPWIMRSATGFEPSDKWFGEQAVYRISMGNFLFFGGLSLAMLGVRYKTDSRDKFLQHGNWLVKLMLWLVACVLPFFIPNSIVYGYAWLARFGSGLFLIIQMIILLDFTQTWNDAWAARGEEDQHWLYMLLGFTVGGYLATLGVSGLLFYFFKPGGAGSCALNVSLITMALLICVAFSLLSLHPLARGGSLFPSSCISLYCMYLCYSALQSEPRDYVCNGLGQRLTAASGSTLAIGMLLTLASVVYSALRAGSNNNLFSLEAQEPLLSSADTTLAVTSAGLDGVPDDPQQRMEMLRDHKEAEQGERAIAEFEPITYNYAFFHLIFALASMYIAMLMTGWGTAAQEKDRIDVGWTSVWVKAGAMVVTAALYCWSLLAPALFPDREFI